MLTAEALSGIVLTRGSVTVLDKSGQQAALDRVKELHYDAAKYWRKVCASMPGLPQWRLRHEIGEYWKTDCFYAYGGAAWVNMLCAIGSLPRGPMLHAVSDLCQQRRFFCEGDARRRDVVQWGSNGQTLAHGGASLAQSAQVRFERQWQGQWWEPLGPRR